jgi:hypothetical protein
MLLDVDHLSQRMRVEAYELAGSFAREAGWPSIGTCEAGPSCGDYPVMGVHTTVRGLEKEGSNLPHLFGQYGSDNESARTPKELLHVVQNGGAIGVFPRPNFIPPNSGGKQCTKNSDCTAWSGTEDGACSGGRCGAPGNLGLQEREYEIPPNVQNDRDGSSKTFATKYRWLMKHSNGRGTTFTTDFNCLAGTQSPRFGISIPGKVACGQSARGNSVRNGKGWLSFMSQRQRFEHSGIWYEDYVSRTPQASQFATNWTDPDQLFPKKRWKQVIARDALETPEDRIPRFTSYSDASPIRETVYYNDFGPDLPNSWIDQDANRPGAQLFPMKRWHILHSGRDFNLDGMQHVGLVPDLLQDMRNVGVKWEQLQPLLQGADSFLRTWDRSERIAPDHPD